MRPLRGTAPCLALLLILACARNPDADSKSNFSKTARALPTVGELLARESDPLPMQPIGGNGRDFAAQIPGRIVGEIVPVVRADMVRIDIGAERDVFCWFYHQPLNLGEGIVAQSNVGLAYIGSRLGSLTSRGVDQIDAGVSEGRVFLAVDWRYSFDPDSLEQSGAGMLKVIATSVDGHSISCTHDALGYRTTFRRFFKELIASLQFADLVAVAPYYRKIELIELAGQRVGVRTISLREDEAGDTEISIMTSAVIPGDGGQLSSNDRYRLQYSTPEGAIINEFVAEAINGEESMRLELAPRVTGGWNVKGTTRGKPIAATLPSAILPSYLGQMLDLRRALAGRGVGMAWKFESWMPTVDASRLIESHIQITEGREGEGFAIVTKSGPLSLDGISDLRGAMLRSELEIGATRMVVRQVWESGGF